MGLSALAGLLLGLPLAWLTSTLALIPSMIVATVALGVFAGGSALRRRKRGRSETWLYRQLQWRIALGYPLFSHYVGGGSLVTRSGHWATRRGTP